MTEATQIVLAKRPVGDVALDCFREQKVSLPSLADGQVLIRQRFLSLDPYMRPRMTETRSYTPPFELDKPLPEKLTTNGEQGSLDKFQQWGTGKTLRQLASERFESGLDLVGTPEEVAERLEAAMDAIGGDGLLISTPFQRVSRRYITEVCEGLVPALQRRGVVRTAYTQPTLRQTLREF